MSGDQILALVLLLVGGFLVGGVISAWRRSKVLAVVLALLAALAVGGAVLRLVPTLA